jgi:hypothetical protein
LTVGSPAAQLRLAILQLGSHLCAAQLYGGAIGVSWRALLWRALASVHVVDQASIDPTLLLDEEHYSVRETAIDVALLDVLVCLLS